MKDTNLYFILILIAIIIFACVGKPCNQKTLEGFEQGSKVQDTFDTGCIKSCEKEAESNNTPNYKDKCKKNCDKITEQCKFHTFNSPEWWSCLKGVNPNITIPQHIKEQGNTNGQENKNEWEKDLDDFDNSNYDNDMDQSVDTYSHGQYNKELRHNYKKLLKEARNQNHKLKNELHQYSKNNSHQSNGQGIPSSQIPIGDQDLYILKSQIVPPVCPECPPVNCGDCKTKCQPCPPPARCPEPSFDCKKVPNYKAAKTNPYLPVPWLNSFSQFNSSYNA